MNLEFKLVAHNSKAYDETIKLRDMILRKPLGLQFTAKQLAAEKEQCHLAAYNNNELVACLVLVPMDDGTIKMRQVAVAKKHQRKGLGLRLVAESERWAREKGFILMHCNARDVAVAFYEKMGYKRVGEMFTEVTIDHWRMEKRLIGFSAE